MKSAAACVLFSLLAGPAAGPTRQPQPQPTVFHEYSHVLVLGLQKKLDAALGERLKQHPDPWHAVQFYLTGEVVREVLARRGAAFPYLAGRGSMDDAIARTVAAVTAVP